MKREIKFRAWDLEAKKLRYTYVANDYSSLTDILELASSCDGWNDKIILMQYTGIKDGNEERIWEGDIVSNGKTLFLVEWNTQNGGWRINPIKSLIDEDYILMAMDYQPLGRGYHRRDDLEVIGNRYENREHLEL